MLKLGHIKLYSCDALENNNFSQIYIYGNANNVAPADEVNMQQYIKILELKFKLNFYLIKPFKKILNILFGNNINYWLLKIYHRLTRNLPFADAKIANYVPDVLIIAKKL